MDPVTIEKLRPDSLGKGGRPVRYFVEYVARCTIKQIDGAPVALKQIQLNEPGRYRWSGEKVNIPIIHNDGFSKRSDSARKLTFAPQGQKLAVCPVKLENGNWYFLNFGDPVIIGVYIHIDLGGVFKQYIAYSGSSPFQQPAITR